MSGLPYHRIHGPEVPAGRHPRTSQILFLDPDEADNVRAGFSFVDPNIMAALAGELRERNALFQRFEQIGSILRRETMLAIMQGRNMQFVTLDVVPPTEEQMRTNEGRRYAAPTSDYEVHFVTHHLNCCFKLHDITIRFEMSTSFLGCNSIVYFVTVVDSL